MNTARRTVCLSSTRFSTSLTNHVVCNMNLDIPFIVENHLALDALISLLLKKTAVEKINLPNCANSFKSQNTYVKNKQT